MQTAVCECKWGGPAEKGNPLYAAVTEQHHNLYEVMFLSTNWIHCKLNTFSDEILIEVHTTGQRSQRSSLNLQELTLCKLITTRLFFF